MALESKAEILLKQNAVFTMSQNMYLKENSISKTACDCNTTSCWK